MSDISNKTTEDLVQKIGNRFLLNLVLSKRVRQLKNGHFPRINVPIGVNTTDIAMEEVRQGKIGLSILFSF